VSDWKPVVDTYTTWQREPRVTLTLHDGRRHVLTRDEAVSLQTDLVAALADINAAHPDEVEIEVDEMFDDEPRCNAATHGPRNSTCTCEDSRDE
jgi:hypothetical protein